MPDWNRAYVDSLNERFQTTINGLGDRLESVARGRVVPAVDAITIGSGRSVRAAVLFFDIRNFTGRTGSFQPEDLKRSLFLLDCVIPMVMHIVHDFGGYVEKNTGDGVMAIIGVGEQPAVAANAALSIATSTFYAIDKIVNPAITPLGIPAVSARIGIDIGQILLARVGVPTGGARVERSFLTAVGPAANLANKLQGMAGTDEIWCADGIKVLANPHRQQFFIDVTPPGWNWSYHTDTGVDLRIPYRVWNFGAERKEPPPRIDIGALRRALGLPPTG